MAAARGGRAPQQPARAAAAVVQAVPLADAEENVRAVASRVAAAGGLDDIKIYKSY